MHWHLRGKSLVNLGYWQTSQLPCKANSFPAGTPLMCKPTGSEPILWTSPFSGFCTPGAISPLPWSPQSQLLDSQKSPHSPECTEVTQTLHLKLAQACLPDLACYFPWKPILCPLHTFCLPLPLSLPWGKDTVRRQLCASQEEITHQNPTTLASDFQSPNCETGNFCCLSHLVYSILSCQPKLTNTDRKWDIQNWYLSPSVCIRLSTMLCYYKQWTCTIFSMFVNSWNKFLEAELLGQTILTTIIFIAITKLPCVFQILILSRVLVAAFPPGLPFSWHISPTWMSFWPISQEGSWHLLQPQKMKIA